MKKNNSNFINFGLYIDALKQLRLIGFISLAILMIVSILMPVGRVIEMNQNLNNDMPVVITTMRACVFMYGIFIVFAPLVTLYMFSFLTKRNSSDYFHSFPLKRGSLYNTYYLAVVTWISFITFFTTVAIGITYSIFHSYFLFSYANLIKFSFSIFVCSLLVSATIVMACSVTGTIFTNIVVTGLILFLPRLILLIAVSMVTSSLQILVRTNVLPLLDYNYNLVFSSLSYFYDRSTGGSYQMNGIIYTLILAMIYIIIGRILFIRRKSETAGNPSANPVLQSLIRVGIAIPICLFPISYIFDVIINKDKVNDSDLFFVIVFYIGAVVAMMIYELLSTKKIRNVIRTIPSIGILVVVNVFIILGMNGIYQSQLNFCPSASEVKYIMIGQMDTDGEEDYFELEMSSKKIKNQELTAFLVQNLEKTLEYERTSYPVSRGNSSNSKSPNGQDAANISRYITIGFRTGTTVKYRVLCVDADNYQKYVSLLFSSQDIKDFFLDLPEYDDNLMTLQNNLTVAENKEIYNSLKEELKSVDYNKWYSLLYENYNSNNLCWSYIVNDRETITYLPLSIYTPKTMLKYVNFINKSTGGTEIEAGLNKIIAGENCSYSINVQSFEDDYVSSKKYLSFSGKPQDVSKKSQIDELYKSMDKESLKSISSLKKDGQTLVKLNLFIQGEDLDNTEYSKNYERYEAFAYIDKAELEKTE